VARNVVAMEIRRGIAVEVVNAFGQRQARVALTGVIAGRDFPVVWVCRREEWEAAYREHREPEGMPYPAEDVRVAVPA
jgi:hypothetical protein